MGTYTTTDSEFLPPLSEEDRERLFKVSEELHRNWKTESYVGPTRIDEAAEERLP